MDDARYVSREKRDFALSAGRQDLVDFTLDNFKKASSEYQLVLYYSL